MTTAFEKTDIYKKALKEYQDKIYGEILKPIHSIIENEDEVYLLYNQAIISDVYIQVKDIYIKYKNDETTDFPIFLWCEEPRLQEIVFMWSKYKSIFLWYDNWYVPDEFKSKFSNPLSPQ